MITEKQLENLLEIFDHWKDLPEIARSCPVPYYVQDGIDAVWEAIKEIEMEDENVCSLCGKPGADKIPHPMHWPTERCSENKYVHADCEKMECEQAFFEFRREVGEEGIKKFLRKI